MKFGVPLYYVNNDGPIKDVEKRADGSVIFTRHKWCAGSAPEQHFTLTADEVQQIITAKVKEQPQWWIVAKEFSPIPKGTGNPVIERVDNTGLIYLTSGNYFGKEGSINWELKWGTREEVQR